MVVVIGLTGVVVGGVLVSSYLGLGNYTPVFYKSLMLLIKCTIFRNSAHIVFIFREEVNRLRHQWLLILLLLLVHPTSSYSNYPFLLHIRILHLSRHWLRQFILIILTLTIIVLIFIIQVLLYVVIILKLRLVYRLVLLLLLVQLLTQLL